MVWRWLAAIAIGLVLGACGRIGFGTDKPDGEIRIGSDASVSDARVGDGGASDGRVRAPDPDAGSAPEDARVVDGSPPPRCPVVEGCVAFRCESSPWCYLACSEARGRTQAESVCYAFTDGRFSCIDTRAELDCVASNLAGLAGRFWLGHEQDGSATLPGEGWTCYALPIFDGWSATQPNDGPGTVGIEDYEEQVAVFDPATGGPDDTSSLLEWSVLCEVRPL